MLNEQMSQKREANTQIMPKAERRQFSVEYRLRILKEADGCRERGEIGVLLRQERTLCVKS